MIDVLFISSKTPPAGMIADTAQKLDAEGAQVFFAGPVSATWLDDHLSDAELAESHALPRKNRRRAVDLPRGEQLWLRARSDSWLRDRARNTHVLVALDDGAVYTVWQLAQRNRTAEAVYGFAPAVTAVRDLHRRGGPSEPRHRVFPPAPIVARGIGRAVQRIPASIARTLTARPIMRNSIGAKLWRLPLRVPGMPAGIRVSIGRRVAEAMTWADKPGGGAYALALTASKVEDPAVKAELLDEAVRQDFSRGVNSKHTDKAVKALLAHADGLLAEEQYEASAAALRRALVLGFHRVSHIDQLSSPLAADPGAYVRKFHDSTALRKVMEPRGRVLPAAPPPSYRPLRLLVVTSANSNFLQHILDRYREHPGVEVRFLDVATQPSLKRISWGDTRTIQQRLGGDDDYEALVKDLMRPHLNWADTVFVDWCVGPAAMLTTIDPGDTRIIVRLHSYEAFTRWPQLVDFSRVDDLVFVADHVKDLVTTQVPQLRGPQSPRKLMLHNAMDLDGFVREKTPESPFNLGLIGVGQVAKDPLWAVEVLRLLRERDERYRLFLIGGDMERKASRATRKYRNIMERELKPLVESGAVLRLGPTDDVADKLTDIGFILSSSVREGCHVGLMEGAASGAVPVVRDWPFFAGKPHSARTLYPEGWVVDSPAAAAQRILGVNASEETRRDHSKLATEHALSTWDWSVVSADFDRLFLGESE